MPSQTEVNMVEFYVRFMVGAKHVPYVDGDFVARHNDLMKLIPRDLAIVSHNGGLTAPQKRVWGRDAFKKATDYRSDEIPKPANIFPCLLKAMDISREDGIPLSALTIGHMHHTKGRADVTHVIDCLAKWIETRPEITKPTFFEAWDDLDSRGLLDDLLHQDCQIQTVEDWFKEWSIKGGIRQIVTPELEQEREADPQWGAW